MKMSFSLLLLSSYSPVSPFTLIFPTLPAVQVYVTGRLEMVMESETNYTIYVKVFWGMMGVCCGLLFVWRWFDI